MTHHKEILLERIKSKTAIVGIIGLGYVGLPLALTFAEKAFRVIGFDVDSKKIDNIAAGKSYLKHIDSGRIASAVNETRFSATTNFESLTVPDVILIAVPTPLSPQREPDMKFVENTVAEIAKRIRPGQLVVLESTTYPGTTDELVKTKLEQSGLVCGKDFFLAFSPEREDPGNKNYSTQNIPKVVGGVDSDSAEVAEKLYAGALARVVPVASARAAEAVKLTENIFRAVNIALVNELKVVYEQMGIDVWDVLDAAGTKPFGFMKFTPGPGLGGHCIPIDPFYLTWKAREFGISTRFIELAGEINVSMPRYVIERTQFALNRQGRAVKNARVLLMGIAYKKDVDDSRESPAFELMHLLLERGAEVSYHDPFVPTLPVTRAWGAILPKQDSVTLTPESVAQQDVVLIATDHTDIDYDMIAQHARLIVDTRGVYRAPRANVVKA